MTRLLMLGLLAGCPPAADTGATLEPGPRVVILVLDGVRLEESLADAEDHGAGWSDAAEAATDDVMPEVRSRLLARGARVRRAVSAGNTNTVPAHATFVTGARRTYANMPMVSGPRYYRPLVPTLGELARRDLGLDAHEVALVGNTWLLTSLEYGLHPDLGAAFETPWHFVARSGDPTNPAADDRSVVREVREHLQDGARFVLANLHHVDLTAHQDHETYVPAVSWLDGAVADLWDWIQGQAGLADQVLLVVTADHGRHRFTGDTPWQHHGCACSGCREVPLLLLGPGVKQGVVVDEGEALLEDVTATAAAFLGVDLPQGTGRVLAEAFDVPPDAPDPTGPTALAAHGGLRAWEEPGEGTCRRRVVLDGGPVDPEGALLLEAPAVARGEEADFACWRRLDVDPAQAWWNWTADCRRRVGDGEWEALGFPTVAVGWDFAPALAPLPGGGLLVAFADVFEKEVQGLATQDDGGVRLARWTPEGGWAVTDRLVAGHGPADPALVLADDGTPWLAWAAGHESTDGQDSRRVRVAEVAWPTDGEAVATEVWAAPEEDDGSRVHARHEAPALTLRDGVPWAAWHAMGDAGNCLLVAPADGTGGPPVALDAGGRVLPHVPPRWDDGGRAWWVRSSDAGTVEVCGGAPGGASTCTDTGRAWVDSLAVDGDAPWFSASDGARAWTAETLLER